MNAVNWRPFLLSIMVGVVIYFLPSPEGVDPRAWELLSVFVACIVGIILKPVPMGVVALLGLTTLMGLGTLTFKEAFSSFSDEVVWLVVMAFFIARGFSVTGFGERLAYLSVRFLGRRTLGLGYGILATDLLLAPAIPSQTARLAGVIYPVLRGLSRAFGSHPGDVSSRRIGAFLILNSVHGTAVTSAMFLTAMAGNPLILELAKTQGIELSWGLWALAASVPGIVSLICIPLVLFYFYPPEVRYTPDAVTMAKARLQELGPLKAGEKIMVGTMVLLLVLWIFGGAYGVRPAEAALIGLCILLLTGVLHWKDLLQQDSVWETYIWFSALIMMAGYLNKFGLTTWLGSSAGVLFSGMSWKVGFAGICLSYFYLHYFFASATAHIASLYLAFLAVALAMGTPPLLGALVLAFMSNLFGGLTHYASSPAPLLFGAGFVDVKRWWQIGFIMSVALLLIWGSVGIVWWKFLGLW